MRIAVASEGLEVSPHAGHCSKLHVLYRQPRRHHGMPEPSETPASPGATMAELFQDVGVDVLVCGGIDMDMANAFCHAGIEVVAGAAGSVRRVAESYLNHTLIGTEELCHLLDEAADADDEETGERVRPHREAIGVGEPLSEPRGGRHRPPISSPERPVHPASKKSPPKGLLVSYRSNSRQREGPWCPRLPRRAAERASHARESAQGARLGATALRSVG